MDSWTLRKVNHDRHAVWNAPGVLGDGRNGSRAHRSSVGNPAASEEEHMNTLPGLFVETLCGVAAHSRTRGVPLHESGTTTAAPCGDNFRQCNARKTEPRTDDQFLPSQQAELITRPGLQR